MQSLHAVGRQQQQILEQSIEYQEALINERAEGIAVIQRDMAELNSMMKEINSMVIGQQDLVSMCRGRLYVNGKGVRPIPDATAHVVHVLPAHQTPSRRTSTRWPCTRTKAPTNWSMRPSTRCGSASACFSQAPQHLLMPWRWAFEPITLVQQAARKKMCYILLICVIVLAVIITVVVIKTT